MCILCTQLWTEDHWTEVASAPHVDSSSPVVSLELHADLRGRRLRDRLERVRLAGAVLAGVGLRLQDWEGTSYLLSDAKGSVAVIHDLARLWPEAERMIGRALDPLDPALLDRLSAPARSDGT